MPNGSKDKSKHHGVNVVPGKIRSAAPEAGWSDLDAVVVGLRHGDCGIMYRGDRHRDAASIAEM